MAAQTGDSFRDAASSSVRYTATPFSSRFDCADFLARTGDDYSVLMAQLQSLSDAPDHCRITGVIPPEILFEVNLPLAWKSKPVQRRARSSATTRTVVT